MRIYSDELYEKVKHRLLMRSILINQITEISEEIERLKKLRHEKRMQARRLKSAAIAHEAGVSKSWVEKISEGKIKR